MKDVCPPNNPEAEEAVLGSLLIDRDAVVKVAPLLRPEDFYRQRNAWIYAAVLGLYERHEPPDFVTISAELDRQGRLDECGGREYLTSLLNAVPTAAHAVFYAGIVREASIRRRIIQAGGQITRLGYDTGREISDALLAGKMLMAQLSSSNLTIAGMNERLLQYHNRTLCTSEAGEAWGVPTGYAALDTMIVLEPGTMAIIAGRPGVGKSGLALCIARNLLARGMAVVFVSLEMSAQALAQRLLSLETGLPGRTIRRRGANDDETAAITQAVARVKEWPLFIDDRGNQNLATIQEYISSCVLQQRAQLAVVDYLQLISVTRIDAGNRNAEVALITRSLRQMSKDLGLPILVLSQLSRSIEARTLENGLLPYRKSDLRDSGAIESDADIVVFIDRPHAYNPQRFPLVTDERGRRLEPARLVIAKNRQGETGEVRLMFHPPTVEFV